MWKIVVGFIVFAAIVLFVLNKAGGDVDMSGEKHSNETNEPVPATAPPSASAASGP